MGLISLIIICFIITLLIFGPIAFLAVKLDEYFPIVQLLHNYAIYVTTSCIGTIIGSIMVIFATWIFIKIFGPLLDKLAAREAGMQPSRIDIGLRSWVPILNGIAFFIIFGSRTCLAIL